jgi:hypothetical protein
MMRSHSTGCSSTPSSPSKERKYPSMKHKFDTPSFVVASGVTPQQHEINSRTMLQYAKPTQGRACACQSPSQCSKCPTRKSGPGFTCRFALQLIKVQILMTSHRHLCHHSKLLSLPHSALWRKGQKPPQAREQKAKWCDESLRKQRIYQLQPHN